LVAGHDHAKRYLVSAEPSYRAQLSPISVATLALQGGDMGPSERTQFEADASFDALVTLRRADDAAKVAGCTVPSLDTWRPKLDRLAETRS
jgi:gamma-butyrobetaine dioxygenase